MAPDGLPKAVSGDTTQYVLDLVATLPVVISDTEAVYLYGLDIIAQQEVLRQGSGQAPRLYYVHDGLGSVRHPSAGLRAGLVDTTGQIETDYAYDPFGVPLVGGEVYNPYQYTGEAWDAEVELLYLRARYYQPEVGRFVTRDPTHGDPLAPRTANPYAYATSSPPNLVDATGFQGEEPETKLQEWNRRFRRPITGPIFALKTVVLNKPVILYYARAYSVEPALLASIIYWESHAIERLPLNALGMLPIWYRTPLLESVCNIDLWKFLAYGEASIGIGQMRVARALYLEDEFGRVSPVTPDAPILGRSFSVALRLTVDWEAIRYAAANIADAQITVRKEGRGLGLSEAETRALIMVGYNRGQEEVAAALRAASQGDRTALTGLLARR